MKHMYIELKSIKKIGNGGLEMELPSEIIRYIEFENTVLFLLNANGEQNHIISIKYSNKDPHEYYVAWEFKYRTQILDFRKYTYKNKECIKIRTWDSIIFIIDPDNGNVIFDSPTK